MHKGTAIERSFVRSRFIFGNILLLGICFESSNYKKQNSKFEIQNSKSKIRIRNSQNSNSNSIRDENFVYSCFMNNPS